MIRTGKNSTTQKVPLYLVARRKLRSLLDGPRRINANLVVPNLTGQQLSRLANRNLIPPFATATTLSAAQDWDKLSNYVLAHEHPLIKPIANYLKSAEPAFDAKTTTNEKIERTLRETEALEKLSMRELLSASSFFTQFGFFKASAAFRYAAIAHALAKHRPDTFETRAAQVELAGSDWDALDDLQRLYHLPHDTVLHQHKKATSEAGFDILAALKKNSAIAVNKQKESLAPNVYKVLLSLRKRRPDLAGCDVALIGPSVRESEAISDDWPDKVLRIGYRGADSVSSDFKLSTHISFYKDHKLSDLDEKDIAGLANELSHLVISNLKADTLEKTRGFDNVYYSHFTGRILFDAECNAGVEALLCALDGGARKVHIKNLDLFVNSLYPQGYKHNYEKRELSGGWRLGDEIICRSMSQWHAPIAQYNIFKNFWNASRITGDNLFTQLMDAGVLAYLDRLESTYCPFKQ
ncbi:hypothetical protein [Halorhodospira halochloris]|uniref:hypothetical protein n=1 Tax=Halorhodospira halochloris TaxID=1052 RepID=UPI001EE92054|nr:hypothetical protein [Halorhodospira halochloris]MCG5549465.1 hypothetical protein [Halorhodospira halochloris]